jgi:hypothetical protein
MFGVDIADSKNVAAISHSLRMVVIPVEGSSKPASLNMFYLMSPREMK